MTRRETLGAMCELVAGGGKGPTAQLVMLSVDVGF